VGVIWLCISVWDTTLSQFIPEEIAKDAPRVYKVLFWLADMTTGWLTWHAWLITGIIIFALCAVEYAFRLSREEMLRLRYLQPLSATAEKGYLDFYVDGLQAMTDLTNSVSGMAKHTGKFAKGLNKYAFRIRFISSAKWRRRYASRVANYINAYAERLQKTANFIASVTPVVAENQIPLINNEADTKALQAFADASLATAENVIPGTLESLSGMRQSVSSIKGISADLNAAGSRLDSVLGEYIDRTTGFSDVCKQLHACAILRIAQVNNEVTQN
jgi:hypothetical protein